MSRKRSELELSILRTLAWFHTEFCADGSTLREHLEFVAERMSADPQWLDKLRQYAPSPKANESDESDEDWFGQAAFEFDRPGLPEVPEAVLLAALRSKSAWGEFVIPFRQAAATLRLSGLIAVNHRSVTGGNTDWLAVPWSFQAPDGRRMHVWSPWPFKCFPKPRSDCVTLDAATDFYRLLPVGFEVLDDTAPGSVARGDRVPLTTEQLWGQLEHAFGRDYVQTTKAAAKWAREHGLRAYSRDEWREAFDCEPAPARGNARYYDPAAALAAIARVKSDGDRAATSVVATIEARKAKIRAGK